MKKLFIGLVMCLLTCMLFDYSIEAKADESRVEWLTTEKTYYRDLNGDGKKEKVRYVGTTDSYGKLYINNVCVHTWQQYNTARYGLVDVISSDKYVELYYLDWSEKQEVILRYKSEKSISRYINNAENGEWSGIGSEGMFTVVTNTGNNEIIVSNIFALQENGLGTYVYTKRYKIGNGRLYCKDNAYPIDQEQHIMLMKAWLGSPYYTLNKNMRLYTTYSKNQGYEVIKKGSELKPLKVLPSTKSDSLWLKVKDVKTGKTGWLLITNDPNVQVFRKTIALY